MNASPPTLCPSCGRPLSITLGFCPVCLLRAALAGREAEPGDSPSEDAPLVPTDGPSGARFEHYELVQGPDGNPLELGRGARGVTYQAVDLALRRPVALKVIAERCLSDPRAQRRFVREARAAARVRHPNMASVYHLGQKGGQYFYAMEWVAGETLEARLRREGRLEVNAALDIAGQVTAALGALHQQGLVHRDVKPSNVMLSRGEGGAPSAKLIDLGLAKAVQGTGPQTTLSLPGAFVGTPAYASPEQFTGLQKGPPADLCAVTRLAPPAPREPEKVSVARLPVTGGHLFGREEEPALLDAVWADPKVNVVTVVAWGGVGKSTLVNHWLRRLAAKRYGSAQLVFGWSFYRQGTTGEVASADEFLDAALSWFDDPDPRRGTAWEKGELRKASEEFGGHCLALTLLGSYLTDAYEGDIRRRVEISTHLADYVRQGAHARNVMASYQSWFGEGPDGRFREALHGVYLPQIQRGDACFAANVLGATGALLSVLIHFFQDGRWGLPVQTDLEGQRLAGEDQLFLLMQAGLYLTATRGYSAPEARICYERAESLACSLHHPLLLYLALMGQWRYSLVTDKLTATLQIAQRIHLLAQGQNEPALLIGAYCVLAMTLYYLGDFEKDMHGLAVALSHAAVLGYYEGNPAEVERLTLELIELCTRQYFAQWLAAGEILLAWSRVISGRTTEGLASIEEGIRALRMNGLALNVPTALAIKAEALHLAGRTPEALEAIREAEAVVERFEDREWSAELHRLRGLFLAAMGADEAQIEAAFGAAIHTATQQNSVSLLSRAEASHAVYRGQKRGR